MFSFTNLNGKPETKGASGGIALLMKLLDANFAFKKNPLFVEAVVVAIVYVVSEESTVFSLI